MRLRQFYVYITTNGSRSTLYIGITNDLTKRIEQHTRGRGSTFTSKYKTNRLVYYEVWDDAESAIMREKQLKNWRREWKINLIRELNPNFDDLFEEFGRS